MYYQILSFIHLIIKSKKFYRINTTSAKKDLKCFSASNIETATNYAVNLNYMNIIEVGFLLLMNKKRIQDGLDNLMKLCLVFVKFVDNLQSLLMKIIKSKSLKWFVKIV